MLFENVLKNIISEYNIINESVKVDDIRNMIEKMNEKSLEYKKRDYSNFIQDYLLYFAKQIAHDMKFENIEKLIEKSKNDENFYYYFINLLSNSDFTYKKFISKLAKAFIDYYNITDISELTLYDIFKEAADTHEEYFKNFINHKNEKTYIFNQILSKIDASNITDDDIKIFTSETFKDYTRKVKSEFSYALMLKNNQIIGYAYFDENGRIAAVRSIYYSYNMPEIDKNSNLKELLEQSDKIIAISNNYSNNIKHRTPYHEKTDDEVRQANQWRYKNTIEQNKIAKKKEELKNTVDSLIKSIKNDLLPYKNILMNFDIFDDNNDIINTFIKLKNDIQITQNELQKYLESSWRNDKNVMDAIQNLKLTYVRLISILKNKTNDNNDDNNE